MAHPPKFKADLTIFQNKLCILHGWIAELLCWYFQVHTQSFSSSWTVPQQRTLDTSSHPWAHQEEEESSRKCDSCHHIHHTAAAYPHYFLYHKISKHRDQPVGREKKRRKKCYKKFLIQSLLFLSLGTKDDILKSNRWASTVSSGFSEW